MAETRTVDLSARMDAFRKLTAEWWEDKSKFVVVRGATGERSAEFALRLDLDKRAFLDMAADEETDRLMRSHASEIAELVWNERRNRMTTRQVG
jgi:hypothetical protein